MSHEPKKLSHVTLPPELENALQELGPRGREPEHDLWPGIRDAIRQPAERRDSSRLVLLAAAMVAAAVVGVAGWWLASRAQDTVSLSVATRTEADLPPGSTDELRRAFARHLDERAELLRRLETALDAYPPELRGEVQNNIAVIEAAMREIETSLDGLVDNRAEELRLATLYDQELRLLQGLNDRLRRRAPGKE